MKALISSCLLGDAVRYDGGSKTHTAVLELAQKLEVLRVCPESASGLPVPRPPAEQRDGRVYLRDGQDVTQAFAAGAAHDLARAHRFVAPLAILKAKSPSCGSGVIYDGTYTGTTTAGWGTFAAQLQQEGVCVVDETIVANCKPSVEHPVAIVLGTGLGHLNQLVKPVRRISYYDMDGFPARARPLEGHSFEATVGTIDAVPVVVYPGRIHLYAGYTPGEVTSLVRHAHKLGCKDIIFAAATGAVPPNATPGLGVISDHINLTGTNPLATPDALRDLPTPFVGMNDAYTPYLRTLAKGVAADKNIPLHEGIYAGTLGPTFETPAEVALLGTMGVSYAGMSLTSEVIVAHALGMNVLGLTLATNVAGDATVTHDTVLARATEHAQELESLVRGVLHLLLSS